MPDLASASRLASLPEPFQKGIRRHRQIDAFTDAHPRVKSCVRRFPSPYRRFGGILTDVYFDYFLARDWSTYSSVPRPHFIAEVYRDIETCLPEIPSEASHPLQRMCDEDWLSSYHTVAGIADILSRISRRLRRPFDLSASVTILQEHESAFSADFHSFFPELQSRVHEAANLP